MPPSGSERRFPASSSLRSAAPPSSRRALSSRLRHFRFFLSCRLETPQSKTLRKTGRGTPSPPQSRADSEARTKFTPRAPLRSPRSARLCPPPTHHGVRLLAAAPEAAGGPAAPASPPRPGAAPAAPPVAAGGARSRPSAEGRACPASQPGPSPALPPASPRCPWRSWS